MFSCRSVCVFSFLLSQTVRTSGSTRFHERDERHTSMADTIHLQPEISPRASVVHREITLKVATTFDFMGTLNCSLFVVGCSNAVSKSENFFFISSRGNKSKTESELPQNQK